MSPASSAFRVSACTPAPSLHVVAFHGALEPTSALAVAAAPSFQAGPDDTVVADLTGARSVSAVAARALVDALVLRGPGKAVCVVADPVVRGTLTAAAGRHALPLLESAAEVVTAPCDLQPMDMRALRNRALVTHALTVVRKRYGLPGQEDAFDLLRTASQDHNVPVRALASALLTVRPPQGAVWFPGRRRTAPPASDLVSGSGTVTGLLEAALEASLAVAGTPLGHVQVVQPLGLGLGLERQHGLGPGFTEHFAHVHSGTPCTEAWRRGRRVAVADTATAPECAPATRSVLVAAGSRSAQSTPVPAPSGTCVAVLSTHATAPGALPDDEALTGLDAVARDAGRWLDWHRRTVVFTALERLHAAAQRAVR